MGRQTAGEETLRLAMEIPEINKIKGSEVGTIWEAFKV